MFPARFVITHDPICCLLKEMKCDDGSVLCPLAVSEHAGYVPVRLGPHPQPHGQQGRCGGRDHPGQPVGPSHCSGGQRQGGTYHRLPGGLQREPAQGTVTLSPTGKATE